MKEDNKISLSKKFQLVILKHRNCVVSVHDMYMFCFLSTLSLQTGQQRWFTAHCAQQTIWPQGRNSTAAGRFLHTRHRLVGLSAGLLFGVRSTPVLPQWRVKGPGHSDKNAGGRLHPNTHTPLTRGSRSGLTMLSRHSKGNLSGKTSSHATR